MSEIYSAIGEDIVLGAIITAEDVNEIQNYIVRELLRRNIAIAGGNVITNLLPAPSKWSLSGVTVSDGVFTFSTGTVAMASYGMSAPKVNHLYYGRVEYQSPSGFTCGDGRFEYFMGDGENKNAVFHQFAGAPITNGEWKTSSNILSFTAISSSSGWSMRNFVVSGSAVVYRKDPLLIDLTDAFGAGNEPSKEWCDTYIPYFTGSIGASIAESGKSTSNSIRETIHNNCVAGGYTTEETGTILSAAQMQRYVAFIKELYSKIVVS